MNRALIYLWLALLKRQALHFVRGLRQPGALIGIAALGFMAVFLFRQRHHEWFAELVRPEMFTGGILIMLCGSVFKGFLQRGLVFDPPDIDFLFTSPFTQRQIVFYRLLPGYLYAFVQGLVFLAFLSPHLEHPWVTTACLILAQIVCFHLAAGAAIYAGTLPQQLHHRIRWMLLAVYFVLAALYLRVAWDFRIIPSFMASPIVQLLFHPADTVSDVGTAPVFREWTRQLMMDGLVGSAAIWSPAWYLVGFVIAATASLGLLLKMKADIFETSLAMTMRVADRRVRLRQGRVADVQDVRPQSAELPKLALFQGAGAIVWKNLVVAGRSRRGLLFALVVTLIYTGFLIALRVVLQRLMADGGELPADQIQEFDLSLMGLLLFLGFFLQRSFPFDFRRDGHHLVAFRTLPVSAFAIAFAEIAVPTALCLAFQALGIVLLMFFGGFKWEMLLLLFFAFPAIAIALNGVWNLHYLLAASKRAAGRSGSTSPVGMLMVVVLSFLIFYPAGWTAVHVGNRFVEAGGKPGVMLGGASFLAVQYVVDLVLVCLLAKLFQRFEVSRDFQ
ncbi:MAG: hypothetical protein H7X97_01560 [Opitutaceae bacterium]|nr:hypothetical protein [Verrucomicrobiales bacterium]